jgi:conjugative relaxase-like TrwC/TraI family protein
MLYISPPLNAKQVATYHAKEYSSAADNYYSADAEIKGQWVGRLAAGFGMSGDVNDTEFLKLAEGKHPKTEQQLIRIQASGSYTNDVGKEINPVLHRAGWDAMFGAPKSVSLVALVGGDDRVRVAHREAVAVALGVLEDYTQGRVGGVHRPETTSQFIAATFEHDSSRPVNGYAAPQLHTHAVVMNMTRLADGRWRSLQPREIFKAQPLVTAVYRSELAQRLVALGYQIDRGQHNQPEIRGISAEYMEASSPRTKQVREALERSGLKGANAMRVAVLQTREAKIKCAHEVMQAKHQEMSAQFGHQAQKAVAAARGRGVQRAPERAEVAQTAISYATDRNIERAAVVDERAILRDALVRTMGMATVVPLKAELERRVERLELLPRSNGTAAARAFTTPQMVALEQATIQTMRDGRDQQPVLGQAHDAPHLNESQRQAVRQVLTNRDTVMALEGVAGGGKTTALAVVKEAAEREGYRVQGLAPTSRAAQILATAGIESQTLQRHLQSERSQGRNLYVLDEASLSSTVQMHQFLTTLNKDDRVLLVGDVRQHQSVEAGRIYEQLQEAGVQTARIETVVRQVDPEYRNAVERLAKGETTAALRALDDMGRVHQVPRGSERLAAVASAFVAQPSGTIIVSPDNRARTDLNHAIHTALTKNGAVREKAHTIPVLEPRQDLTGPDRAWAAKYQPGDVVRYAKTSRVHEVAARDYATVLKADGKKNLLTVRLETGRELTYDPKRLTASVYRPSERSFAVGDRVQFTQPYTEKKIANRQLGTIAAVTPTAIRVKLESGRSVGFRLQDYAHLDYGYAVTSYSAQGQTADRVLLHIDTGRSPEALVNQRLAYVSLSRGRYDAQIFCNDKAAVTRQLSRDVSHRSALEHSF